jgi:mRNA interferase RelE/StbE
MASYSVEWPKSARKELRSIPPREAQRIFQAVDRLAEDPRPAGSKKLKGSDESYRIRVGDYRVIYDVLDVIRIVLIQRVRHRKDAYRE